MTPDVVVDVGNTFTKTGVVWPRGVIADHEFHDDIASHWGRAEKLFTLVRPLKWLVAGVNPVRQAEFVAWARGRGDNVTEVISYRQLPIKVDVEHPEKVGLDRLLGAVAANRRRTPGRVAITVDVGTAVTINFIDSSGVFTGGLIMPGMRLMAAALHGGTAKLPHVGFASVPFSNSNFPAKSTENAIRTGVMFSIAGAVRMALRHAEAAGDEAELFLTGGDGPPALGLLEDLKPHLEFSLNLYGLLITAESLP